MFTFQFLNDKIHNYLFFFDKLSKTIIFFSCLEGTRGEENQIFRTWRLPTTSIFKVQHSWREISNIFRKNFFQVVLNIEDILESDNQFPFVKVI